MDRQAEPIRAVLPLIIFDRVADDNFQNWFRLRFHCEYSMQRRPSHRVRHIEHLAPQSQKNDDFPAKSRILQGFLGPGQKVFHKYLQPYELNRLNIVLIKFLHHTKPMEHEHH